MIRSTKIVRHLAVRPDRVVDTITLDHHARHRRRVAMTADGGLEFLLDLDRAAVLDHGDALELEDGRLVQVKAADEQLVEITTFNPVRLMRAAWHIGNRHIPAEITEEAIYIVQDPVLEAMLRGLGAAVKPVVRPFKPERGAYEAAEAHGHGQAHAHDHHDHDHHDHGHDHAHHDHAHHDHAHDHHGHDHAHDHAHGASCGCGHTHHHD
ncbi:putative urease accessory protein [Azorhizobium caulinodans ORS 571]|uniref:Urease accessory protein UreE n=1 Tax=Azorhizobium caulinodans (strain ATCC 43989 / DSM 5975 / JCM 20966 / LMG 6465 / NBRC 14845 / NCIMB 13405 / ORS 571) TaxID=438753 RepID=UREE_AZOC5|nr:urease accessory protein UreE [Azorhizobium caulinodans]A8I4S6.1 RecName: Full=Urease accessory protein UreE [Azorhizobium caulinodans ORS 571]BAF87765.1 putative urease accessory protein [Azorhizobium caulinodans ORS 571]